MESARKAMRVSPVAVAYTALSAVALLSLLAFGGVPAVFGGFAHASRLNRIAVELNAHVAQIATADNRHWANQTASSLLRMDQARCVLPRGPFRSLYDQLIQKRMSEYYTLTGHSYPLPRCSDL